MNTLNERLEMAVRNIMSGNNACGTLAKAVQNGDASYFAKMLEPIFRVYEDENAAACALRDAALRDAEAKRFALESILANVPNIPGNLREPLEKAMPGHPFLPK